jgi:hypothetical protein
MAAVEDWNDGMLQYWMIVFNSFKKFKPFVLRAWGTGIEECWNDGMVGESNIPIFQH